MKRIFLVEDGRFVVIRNGDIKIGMNSFEEFYKYCPISEFGIDLTGVDYLCYEAYRNFVINNNNIPSDKIELLIDNAVSISERVKNPYHSRTRDEASNIAMQRISEMASSKIYKEYPAWKQVNIALGLYSMEEVLKIKTLITNIRNQHDVAKNSILNASDVATIKAAVAYLASALGE